MRRQRSLKRETESAAESALVGKIKTAKAHRIREQYYDEWDYKIMDYRRRWCRLVEILDPDEDLNFMKVLFETTLNCRQPFARS